MNYTSSKTNPIHNQSVQTLILIINRYGICLSLNPVMKKIVLISILFICYELPIWGQLGGSSTYNFLKLPNSARVEALGGAVPALFDTDLSIGLQNPSTYNKGMHNQIQLSFNNYLAHIGYGFVGYSRTWNKIGSFMGGIQYLNYGDFIRADESGNQLGTFTAQDVAIYVGYSRSFFDSLLFVGANFKNIISQYAEYNSYGMALDLGVTYLSKNKLFTAGLVLKNMGGQLDPYTPGNREPIPFEIQLGVSQGFKHVPLRLFLTVTNLQRPDLGYYDRDNRFILDPLTGDSVDTKLNIGLNILRHFIIGFELFPFKKHLYLRLAYNFQRGGEMAIDAMNGAVGLSYGIGVRISHFTLSYSRAHYFMTQSPNHFTLNINLDGFLKAKKRKAEAPPPPPATP